MRKCLSAFLVCLITLSCGGAMATENYQWSTPTGLLYFGAGMMPPANAGLSYGLRSVFAYNSALRDQSGHKLDNNFHQSVNVTTPSLLYMTGRQLLGADWGVLIAQPITTNHGGLDVHTPGGTISLSQKRTRLADMTFEPLLLHWRLDHLNLVTGVAVQAPTGSYSRKVLFNAGNNYWTFGPHVAATYISRSGFELSSMVQVDFNTTNHATNYHTGTEFKMEVSAGQHFGDFTVGPVAVAYQQIQADSAPSLTSTVRSRVYSAGLSVNFFRPGLPFTLQGTATKDFGARSHTEGSSLALRAGFSF